MRHLAIMAAAATLWSAAADAQLRVREAADTAPPASTEAASVPAEIVLRQRAARTLRLPRAAGEVVIGSVEVANPVPSTPNVITIYGKGAGTTDLIVYDESGVEMVRTLIRVLETRHGVVVNMGTGYQSYICAPACRPDPVGVVAPEITATTETRPTPDGRGTVTTRTTTGPRPQPPSAPESRE